MPPSEVYDVRRHECRIDSDSGSTGTGSEITKRIAAPIVGGICTSFILELLVYPAIHAVWRERALQQKINRNEIIASATHQREAMALARSLVCS